jgi:predicted enzyme related to lactoylglutathione lyase
MGMPKAEVKGFHHVAINVTDVSRAIAFYESVFSLKQLRRENSGATTPTGAWFAIGALQLHLQGRAPGAQKTDQHFALELASLEGLAERVASAGGLFEEARPLPGYSRRGNVWDPDGNRIEVLAAA